MESEFPEQAIVTEILPRSKFYPVEDHHQDYYLNNRFRYRFYRTSCGRDRRLNVIWGERVSH